MPSHGLFSYKDTGGTRLELHLTVSFRSNHLFKDLLSKYGYILGDSGLGLNHTNLWVGDSSAALSSTSEFKALSSAPQWEGRRERTRQSGRQRQLRQAELREKKVREGESGEAGGRGPDTPRHRRSLASTMPGVPAMAPKPLLSPGL